MADTAFSILTFATDNEYLMTIYRRIRDELARLYSIVAQKESGLPVSQSRRQVWSEYIRLRDRDAAATAAREFIGESHASVLRTLCSWPSIQESEITSLSS